MALRRKTMQPHPNKQNRHQILKTQKHTKAINNNQQPTNNKQQSNHQKQQSPKTTTIQNHALQRQLQETNSFNYPQAPEKPFTEAPKRPVSVGVLWSAPRARSGFWPREGIAAAWRRVSFERMRKKGVSK